MPKVATPKSKYVKANATPESNQVLNIVAAERKMYVYEVLDEVLREKFPDYFRKIGCWETKKVNIKEKKTGENKKSDTFIFSKYVFRV